MQEKSALGRAIAMVRDLRDRCAWDRAQTRETLRPYLIEEAHELAAALQDGESDRIRSEVADLLLHLAWQLVLAEESRDFTPDEVANDLEEKMKRRHPHLFDLGPPTAWEELKRAERTTGILDPLPRTLPPLLLALRLQERAASVGFDWPDLSGPCEKVHEEMGEVEAELRAKPPNHEHLVGEIGDLFFAAVNLARKASVSPEQALRQASEKFRGRFQAIETMAETRGLDLHQMDLRGLDRLWDEVKSGE